MSTPFFSLVICTYNPRADYLERVLQRLEALKFPRDRWELVIVDSKSDLLLEGRISKKISLPYRLVREETAGLAHARARGLRETSGTWMVYVDDDNLLPENYLEELRLLTEAHPHVVVWSGGIVPEFEFPPPENTRVFWPFLALREVKGTLWSNIITGAPLPCGAGMAVRRDVMQRWVDGFATNAFRSSLGRYKKRLLAGDDTDIGLTACEMGQGVGVAETLRLVHLIPAARVQPDYLRKLAYSVSFSHYLLDLSRGLMTPQKFCYSIAACTGRGLQRQRSLSGLVLWWVQIRALFAALLHFRRRTAPSRQGAGSSGTA